jgi:hypothetical protein
MVAVVQLVEHQVVILDVAGSSPVSHPDTTRSLGKSPGLFVIVGASPKRQQLLTARETVLAVEKPTSIAALRDTSRWPFLFCTARRDVCR